MMDILRAIHVVDGMKTNKLNDPIKNGGDMFRFNVNYPMETPRVFHRKVMLNVLLVSFQ